MLQNVGWSLITRIAGDSLRGAQFGSLKLVSVNKLSFAQSSRMDDMNELPTRLPFARSRKVEHCVSIEQDDRF